jgi:tetratricopeptide (TPR) repeat protein
MKRASMLVVALALVTFAVAQQQAPSSSTPPAGQQQGAPAAPATKRPPQAKTAAEYDAYKAAIANPNDPAALEKAADDFAAKFPDSELRAILFRAVMRDYQNSNNGDKLLESAQKLLKLDPDDPEALVNVSEVIAERTRDTDLDKDQRYDEARKYAQHALQTVDTDVPAGVQVGQVDAYKGMLRSTAYSVLGTIDFNQEKYPDAETNFKKSVDAFPSQPDPVVVLRLALALDKQGRYPDALKEANRAVELTQGQENSSAGTLARRERDRLVQLTGGNPSGSQAQPVKPPSGTAPGTTSSPNQNPH